MGFQLGLPVLEFRETEVVADGVLETSLGIAVRSLEVPRALVDAADVVVDGPEGLAAFVGSMLGTIRGNRLVLV